MSVPFKWTVVPVPLHAQEHVYVQFHQTASSMRKLSKLSAFLLSLWEIILHTGLAELSAQTLFLSYGYDDFVSDAAAIKSAFY